MSKRKVSNPLALAVLAQLEERPMHPYEMATTMRERGKEQSIKLNFGSLYTVVDALQRAGFITAQETVREGRRPERTVYEITPAGRTELYDWLCEILGEPAKEYPQFLAGLSLIGVLPPAKATAVLEQREQRLAEQLKRGQEDLAAWSAGERGLPPLPRIFLIETEYELAMHDAELTWLRGLLRDLKDGTLEGLDFWEQFHRARAAGKPPPEFPADAPGEEGAAPTPPP
jgi:DNA-binding PadR family transcriptional regulator